MIFGIGVDQVDIKRVRSLLEKSGSKFENRCFTVNEILYSKRFSDPAKRLSARFAAKEAFAKALGTGFRNNLNFKDIEIMNDKFGKPYYSKTKKITQLIRKEFKVKNFECFLSISDEKEYSTAFTIIQSI